MLIAFFASILIQTFIAFFCIVSENWRKYASFTFIRRIINISKKKILLFAVGSDVMNLYNGKVIEKSSDRKLLLYGWNSE